MPAYRTVAVYGHRDGNTGSVFAGLRRLDMRYAAALGEPRAAEVLSEPGVDYHDTFRLAGFAVEQTGLHVSGTADLPIGCRANQSPDVGRLKLDRS